VKGRDETGSLHGEATSIDLGRVCYIRADIEIHLSPIAKEGPGGERRKRVGRGRDGGSSVQRYCSLLKQATPLSSHGIQTLHQTLNQEELIVTDNNREYMCGANRQCRHEASHRRACIFCRDPPPWLAFSLRCLSPKTFLGQQTRQGAHHPNRIHHFRHHALAAPDPAAGKCARIASDIQGSY
jgi:hypothetical protein